MKENVAVFERKKSLTKMRRIDSQGSVSNKVGIIDDKGAEVEQNLLEFKRKKSIQKSIRMDSMRA